MTAWLGTSALAIERSTRALIHQVVTDAISAVMVRVRADAMRAAQQAEAAAARVPQSMVTMLPAGGSPRGFAELPQARLPHQEHALLRRRGQARHPLRRSVRVSCVGVHAWLALSAPRGLRRAVYHCSPRGTLCIYPSITSYRLRSQRIRRAFGRSRSLGVPCDCARFPRISLFLAPQNAQNFPASQGRTVTGSS